MRIPIRKTTKGLSIWAVNLPVSCESHVGPPLSRDPADHYYIPRPYTRTGDIEILRKERFGELAEELAPRGRVASGKHSRESHIIRLDQREARQHPWSSGADFYPARST